VIPRAFFQR
ncbi:unnamed protein product, partial [Allacma fusca]